jgi:hypothetical protein
VTRHGDKARRHTLLHSDFTPVVQLVGYNGDRRATLAQQSTNTNVQMSPRNHHLKHNQRKVQRPTHQHLRRAHMPARNSATRSHHPPRVTGVRTACIGA